MAKKKEVEQLPNTFDEFVYQGRIAICSPRKIKGMIQHGISAVMISPNPKQPLLSTADNWENIQCEIIIRPIKRLGTMKIKNARLDHAAQALGDESQWEKKTK
jgi:hypothetical protein